MPASIKLQEEFGDKLQVVLVSTSDPPEKAAAFALKKKWLGGRTMWTDEAPFETGLNYIPAAVLLSSSGEVLLVDHPGTAHGKIVELIEEDIKSQSKGPKDLPDPVRKAWGEFAKGNWGKALAAAQAVIDKPPAKDTDAAVAAAQQAIEQFKARIEQRFGQIRLQIDNGLYDQASAALAAIGKGAVGDADLVKRHADLVAELDGEDLKAERAAATALSKLEKKLYADGPEEKSAKQLRAFAEKYPGTLAASRAEELARLAEQ